MKHAIQKMDTEWPSWEGGTDKQRGMALWRFLHQRGLVDGFTKHRGVLYPGAPVTLAQLVLEGKLSKDLSGWREPRRAVSASLRTAIYLAMRAEFVAAGALYSLIMRRFADEALPRAKREWARHRREQGAKLAREKRTALADLRQQKIASCEPAAPARPVSSEAVSRKTGIPASSVRRLRKEPKKT